VGFSHFPAWFRLKDFLPPQDCTKDNFQYERFLNTKGFRYIAGSDEVGRGPLAGPVVAACVILPKDCDPTIFFDSKVLTPRRRNDLHHILTQINAKIGLGIVSKSTIDKINILQASLLAMKHAVEDLTRSYNEPDYLLVDGKFEIPISLPQEALIKGESKSASIAAASIIAKVKRDALMATLHEQYPVYNFKKNKGYPTKEHRLAIARFGPCPEHRETFKGVKEFV
jgi:ribonuclease HII